MISEQDVRKKATHCDIPMVGITDATPLIEFEQKLTERAFTPFCHIKAEKRIDFQHAFPQAQSVIVIGLPYHLRKVKKQGKGGRGHIASFCEERDYHLRVKEKLEALARELLKIQDFDYRIFVDQAQLIDRASAWRAGLGFFGKNNCLINPVYGSAFVIGQLLLSIPVAYQPAVPMTSRCGDCGQCLRACPNGALGEGFDLDAHLCISWLTQKKKITEEEKQRFNTYLYGCDFCQLACPYNTPFDEDEGEPGLSPDVKKILEMNEEEFNTIYGETPLFWRGLEVLKRNGEILMEDSND